MDQAVRIEDRSVLSMEEVEHLAVEGGHSAETLMNVVALIAKRFRTDVCSAYLLEPDRANLVLAATVGYSAIAIGSFAIAGVPFMIRETIRLRRGQEDRPR